MFITVLFTGLVFACSTFLFLKWFRSKKLRLPPGPTGWPLIGNLLVVFQDSGFTSNEQYFYTRCAREYGDIYKLKFGPQMVYVLCKFDYVREAFNHIDIQGRPPSVAYKMAFGPEAKGIIMVSGSEWKAMKQFTVEVFRDLGVGKGAFEAKIQSELERLVTKLDSVVLGNTSYNLMDSFYMAVSNITCGITFGRQFNYEDSRFKEIIGVMDTFSKAIGPSAIVTTNRMLCGLPFGPGKSLRDCLSRFKDFMELEIRGHAGENKLPNNFVDAFLREMKKGDDKNFNKTNLIVCCLELFFAGTETTSSTLYFAILCLVVHPKIQEEVQRELDVFIKENGMPCYKDRSRLPYLQSVILEAHRVTITSPLGVPHVAERDLELFGYDVPKGTFLLPNTGSLFMNPKMFPDPETFNPERYMKDGQFEAIPDVIPFSTGRRACLGEQLARMELFLFLTCLLHRYTFSPPEGMKMPSFLEASYGGVRSPHPYVVVISKRNHVK